MPARRPHRPIRVVAIACPGVAPFELSVACEVFGLQRPEIDLHCYEFRVATVEPGPVRTSIGFHISTPYGLGSLRWADTIYVPAWKYLEDRPPEHLLSAIRRAHARGARIMSVCSGAFVLAAAGLLDGRRATTHWRYAAQLAAQYPDIDVDPSVLYVDNGRVLTSAGTAAGIDLCLHVVRQDYGADIANAIARSMVVPPHRDGGQAQFVDRAVPTSTGDADGALHATLAWMLEHLDQSLTVTQLAHRSAMSPRTFARQFKAVTGTTPHQWLLRQRVLHAQRLLERSDLPVELVASGSGLGSAANLRQHFQRQLGTSPQTYRRTFRASA